MVLSRAQAVDQTQTMLRWRQAERRRLERIHQYVRATQRFDWLPEGTPDEVLQLARMSHVNVLRFVVNAGTQSLYVDGYRTRNGESDESAWDSWQANRMDSRQIEVHRSSLTYGSSYVTVMPSQVGGVAAVRGASPRKMTVVFGEDDDWPMWALEKRRTASGQLWRLWDDEAVYWVGSDTLNAPLKYISTEIHGAEVCPVVRFRPTGDLDDEVVGMVEPLMALQDQINVTTFSLLVAQHYGAHRQRYIIGWLAESEEQALKASAQKLWTFDDDPGDVKVGEFQQTELRGYIDSREATLRHIATISQTPVHELLGSLANLSAEALVAARDSHRRMLEEVKTMFGESHEQWLGLAGSLAGVPVDPSAWVRWRDMEARSLAQVADAFGKLSEQLSIPPQAFWERVADVIGAPQQEVERWRTMQSEDDSIGQLNALLDRQMGAGVGG